MPFTPDTDTTFRDSVTDGVPASGVHNPAKGDIRDTFDDISEGLLDASGRAAFSGFYSLIGSLTAPTGWVALGGYIGGSNSGASTRANADCENLFIVWHINTTLQLKNNAGTDVSRSGATLADAQADFAAGYRMPVPDVDAGQKPTSPILKWYCKL